MTASSIIFDTLNSKFNALVDFSSGFLNEGLGSFIEFSFESGASAGTLSDIKLNVGGVSPTDGGRFSIQLSASQPLSLDFTPDQQLAVVNDSDLTGPGFTIPSVQVVGSPTPFGTLDIPITNNTILQPNKQYWIVLVGVIPSSAAIPYSGTGLGTSGQSSGQGLPTDLPPSSTNPYGHFRVVPDSTGGSFQAQVSETSVPVYNITPTSGSTVTIPAGYGTIQVLGTANTTISDGGLANVSLIGNSGQDTYNISAITGTTTVTTGSGAGIVNLGGSASVVNSNGQDTIYAGSGPVVVVTRSNALIVGGSGLLAVTGGAGAGTIFAGTGGLVYTGGTGFDIVVGGGNTTVVTGGAGGGEFFGGGNATITAGTGGALNVELGGNGDQLYAAGPAGVLFGTVGGDMLMSSLNDTGTSVFFGANGSGRMTFMTGAGNDLLALGQGTNSVTLGSGHDVIFANGGTTSVTTITAGTGSLDLAFSGRSTVLTIAAGTARMFNLYAAVPGADTIQLQGYSPDQAATAIANQVNVGGGTQLSLSDGTVISLVGVAHASANLFG